jgi:hypothetical protein
MTNHRKDQPHQPPVQAPHHSPLSRISFSPILRQIELTQQRKEIEQFMAVWKMAQEHPGMTAEEGLSRWNNDRGSHET